MKTLSLEEVVAQGYASTEELKAAGTTKIVNLGKNDFDLLERVAIDPQGNQWDWCDEDGYWEMRQDGVERRFQHLLR